MTLSNDVSGFGPGFDSSSGCSSAGVRGSCGGWEINESSGCGSGRGFGDGGEDDGDCCGDGGIAVFFSGFLDACDCGFGVGVGLNFAFGFSFGFGLGFGGGALVSSSGF